MACPLLAPLLREPPFCRGRRLAEMGVHSSTYHTYCAACFFTIARACFLSSNIPSRRLPWYPQIKRDRRTVYTKSGVSLFLPVNVGFEAANHSVSFSWPICKGHRPADFHSQSPIEKTIVRSTRNNAQISMCSTFVLVYMLYCTPIQMTRASF